MSLFMNRIMNFMYREMKILMTWKIKYEFVLLNWCKSKFITIKCFEF